MAIKTNIQKAKAKREEEKAKEVARKARMRRRETIWKPKAGTNHFRVLPPWTKEGPNGAQFWREVYIHYGVTCYESPDADNAFAVTCPKETPGAAELQGLAEGSALTCPVCEAVTALRQSQDPADIEMAKNSRAKQQLFSNIIDLDDPTWTKDAVDALKEKGTPEDFLPKVGAPKVQVYKYGPQIMNMLLDFFSDNVDITDLKTGRDLTLERSGTGIDTSYRLRPNLEATKAPITDKQLEDSLEDLDAVQPFFTEAQMHAILQGGSYQEVFALGRGEAESPAKLSAHKEESEEEESEEEESEEEESEEEESEEEESETEEEEEEFPPLDSDGDIDYARLSDEQIEDPSNEDVTDANGSSVYLNCFGAARQRDEDDSSCKDDCGLFERCGKRIAFLDAEEARKAAAKKKGPGKKKVAPGKKAVGKKTVGKSAGNGTKPAAKSGGSVDDLEAEMKAALGR